MSTRRGFTLVELLVGLVVLGIIGAALSRLFLSQARFYDLERCGYRTPLALCARTRRPR